MIIKKTSWGKHIVFSVLSLSIIAIFVFPGCGNDIFKEVPIVKNSKETQKFQDKKSMVVVKEQKNLTIKKEPLPKPSICGDSDAKSGKPSVSVLENPLAKLPEIGRYLYCEGETIEFHARIDSICKGEVVEHFPDDTIDSTRDCVILTILQPFKYQNKHLRIHFFKKDELEIESPWRKISGEVVFTLPEGAIGNKIQIEDTVHFITVYDKDLGSLRFL